MTASATLGGDGGVVTLVEGPAFAISLPSGDMLPGFPHGVFFRDTRFLSELRLRVNGQWPEPLAATTIDPFSAAFVLRDQPQAGLADSHLMVFRNRYVGRGHARRHHGAQLRPRACVLRARAAHRRRLRRPLRGEGEPDREGRRPVGERRGQPAELDVPARPLRPRRAPRLLRRAAAVDAARGVRGDRARERTVVGVPPAHAGHRRRRGDAPLPVRAPRRAGDAGGALGEVATEPADDHLGPRQLRRAARPVDRGSRGAAPVRSRPSRPHGHRGRRALVHDALRSRQPHHVVDDDDDRFRPRARNAADAGAASRAST